MSYKNSMKAVVQGCYSLEKEIEITDGGTDSPEH